MKNLTSQQSTSKKIIIYFTNDFEYSFNDRSRFPPKVKHRFPKQKKRNIFVKVIFLQDRNDKLSPFG